MGWSLGSNDSSNIFGTAVASKMLRYRTAIILCSLFVIAGALLEGSRGLETINSLVSQTLHTAFIASVSAGITVTLMTVLKLPVSTSQAMVGAILGIGVLRGDVNFAGLRKVVISWIGTPIGAALIAIAAYFVLGRLLDALPLHIFLRDRILKYGLIGAGIYGSYALGANNVANVTGVYSQLGLINEFQAVLLGGASIAFGILTYSRNVMMTVGKRLVKLDPFSAFIAVLAEALTVHFYAKVGVPVSTSQAIIGAILGIGIWKGVQTINRKTLFNIVFGWVGTPCVALILSLLLLLLFP